MADAEGKREKKTSEAAAEAANQAREEAAGVFESGRRTATAEAKSAVREMADSQKERAAEGIGSVARSLHELARNLEQERQEVASRYTHMAADQLDRWAERLRQGDWEDMLAQTEHFARRQPALFIGGAVAAGFLAARFLRSREEPEYEAQRYGERPFPEERLAETPAMGGHTAPPTEPPPGSETRPPTES